MTDGESCFAIPTIDTDVMLVMLGVEVQRSGGNETPAKDKPSPSEPPKDKTNP